MKCLLLPIFCILFLPPSFSQTLLDDARILKDYMTPNGTANRAKFKRGIGLDQPVMTALSHYLQKGDTLKEFGQLVAAFSGNPFIQFSDSDQDKPAFEKSFKIAASDGTPSAVPGASGFSVAGFADGLSRFLVKRTKQELSQAFFNDFKQQINRQKILRHFCPATRSHLNLIDQDVYQFNRYLESLRQSFNTDMVALPGHLESYIREDTLCEGCADKIKGKILIDFLHLAQQLVDGESPSDMIHYLANGESAIQQAPVTEQALYNMAGAFRLTELVSVSFLNPNAKDHMLPWFSAREIRDMFEDPLLFRIYMGLLYEKSESIKFVGADGQMTEMQAVLKKCITSGDAGANLYNTWRVSVLRLGEFVHSIQLNVRAGNRSPVNASDGFFRYSESLHALFMAVNQTCKAVMEQKDEMIPQQYLFFMGQCNSLYFNVRERNFTGAVSNIIYCLSELQTDNKEVQKMLKYANFVASVAEANSPEEVERAIELFALPPGSSRIKKQPGRFAFALNAYTGLAGGVEYLDESSNGKWVGAVSAPVGLSLSWGMGIQSKDKKTGEMRWHNWGSLGFFVPVIDVGAVTAYRFKDTAAQDLPEMTWGNILCPGIYLVYDFPDKIPIALGYGGQLGPGIRKVTESGIEINKSGWRQGFFVSVDIPISYLILGKGRN